MLCPLQGAQLISGCLLYWLQWDISWPRCVCVFMYLWFRLVCRLCCSSRSFRLTLHSFAPLKSSYLLGRSLLKVHGTYLHLLEPYSLLCLSFLHVNSYFPISSRSHVSSPRLVCFVPPNHFLQNTLTMFGLWNISATFSRAHDMIVPNGLCNCGVYSSWRPPTNVDRQPNQTLAD